MLRRRRLPRRSRPHPQKPRPNRVPWLQLEAGPISDRKAGIVGEKWAADALHVALATANRCRLIVSWNFKHIVHFDKIPLYNGVNLINGFDTLSINTPSEVIAYED